MVNSNTSILYLDKQGHRTSKPVFSGKFPEILGMASKRNYYLISTHGVIEQRVKSFSLNDSEFIDSWFNFSCLTGDSLIFSPQKDKFKVLLDSENLSAANFKNTSGDLLISNENYLKLDAPEFDVGLLKTTFNKPLSAYEINQSEIWNLLLRGDKALMNEYAKILVSYLSKSGEKHVLKKMPLGLYKNSFHNLPKHINAYQKMLIMPEVSIETLGGVTIQGSHNLLSIENTVGILENERKKLFIPEKTNLESAIEDLIAKGIGNKQKVPILREVLGKYIK